MKGHARLFMPARASARGGGRRPPDALRCDAHACTSASESDVVDGFAQDVLVLYSRAIELKQLDAAELLLQCLEVLAKEAPGTSPVLDAAYVRITDC